MALASGTANPMAQKALIEASKKQKTTPTQTVAPETKKSPIMTDAAMRARGLTTATQQTGNFAKALDAEVKANQAIIDAGGVIQNPSDSMSLSRQAQYGTALGMTIGRTDSEGKAYDMGKTIDQQGVQSEQNWNDIKQQAFESGQVAPSRSQNLYATKNAQPQATTGGKVVETQSMKEGKTKIITLPNGQTKEVPVNLKYEEYLQEKHPGLFETEEKMRRLNTIKQKILAGGQLDQETMQYLQSIGVEPDATHITNAVNTILQNTEDYKMKQNVSGGYLMWQGERGNDVQEEEKKSFGEVVPTEKSFDEVNVDENGNPMPTSMPAQDPNTLTSGDIKTKTVGEMKESGLSSYQSMMDDFKGLITAQIKQMNDSNKAMMDSLQKREDMYQAEKERALSRIEENASHLQSIAAFQKDNQLQQNELEAGKTDRQYGSRLEQMQSRQARYQGYLAAKFQSAGMADSGAGLELLGQYLMAGEMAISEVAEAREDAKMAYLGRAQEIMSDYAEQAYKIESQRIDAGDKVSFDMNEAIMKIQDAKIQSVAKKDENILMAIKELGQKELDLRKQSFAEVMALADQKMKEMEFSQRVIQDAIRNSQWDKSFALEGVREQRAQDAQLTASTGNLWMNNQDTGQRALPGLTYDQNVKEFERGILESDRLFSRGVYENDRAFNRGAYESDRSFDFARDQLDFERMKQADDNTLAMMEKGIKEGYIDPRSGMIKTNSGFYNAEGAKYNAFVEGDRVVFDIPKDKDGKLTSWDNMLTQCGRFVNNLAGKPGMMGDSIESKLKQVRGPIPTIGSFFVQALTGKNAEYGHTGAVEKVYYDDAGLPIGLDIVDSNFKQAGKIARDHIKISYENGKPVYTRNGKKQDIRGFTDSVIGKMSPGQANVAVSPTGKAFIQQPQDTQVGIKDPQDRMNAEIKLSKDLDSYTKNAREAMAQKSVLDQSFAKAIEDMDAGKSVNASTQGLVIAFNKILDPTSVVREGEYARSQQGQALLASMQGKLQQLQSGGAGITRESLQEFKQTADQFMSGYNEQIRDAALRTQTVAQNYGLNLDNIVTPATKEILQGVPSSTGGVRIKNNTTGEIRLFPEGTDVSDLPSEYSIVQ